MPPLKTSTDSDKPGRGRKRGVRTKKLIKNTLEKLRRNPRRCHRELAAEASVSKTSIYRVLKEDLRKKPYKMMKRHEFTEYHASMRAERSRYIRNEIAQSKLPNLVLTDERKFDIQHVVNHQNDRIWSSSSSAEARSPELNALEFSIWFILETRILAIPHSSLESLKVKLQKGWEAILEEQTPAPC
ncbi:hypothetical protein FHG87_017456 [Trinorchestia longiramus]|nr:hypothetical protein FHG87_017456 [Trinorchestia longiramus]